MKKKWFYKIENHKENPDWKRKLKEIEASNQRERPEKCKHDGETWQDETSGDILCSKCNFCIVMGSETKKPWESDKSLFSAKPIR